MARPISSVIISAKNEAERVEACFASLRAQEGSVPFEVIFVDNGSSDGSYRKARRLARLDRRFRVAREPRPGSAAARNHGARLARGKLLLFTDADCRFSPRWVEELSRPLLLGSGYPLAAVGGRTVSASERVRGPNWVERYLDELFHFWEEERLSRFPAFLPWAPTCNLAVKKEIFLGLGGFDPAWKTAAYDVDFCWRLALCGFVLGHAPRAEVKHLRRSSLRGLLRQMENYAHHNDSLLRTYERLLRIPKARSRQERMLSRWRRAWSLLGSTRSVRQLSYRGLDLVACSGAFRGKLRAQLRRIRPDPRLHPSRLGQAPRSLSRQLPRGYQFLHREGWAYWKSSPDAGAPGELVLFRPRRSERFLLNESAWKIWEVKAERGQSEDAAEAIGQSADDREVLRDIDELTLDLRTRRLLP